MAHTPICEDRDPRAEALRFLAGDGRTVSRIRESIDAAVRAFRFDSATAGDLTQDALDRVFFNLRDGRFRGESSLKTYAQGIARYACLEEIRRRRFESECLAESPAPRADGDDPESSFFRREEHRANLKTLAGLPEECRRLLRLVFVEGLTYREVALRLGVTEGAIKSRVRRCRLTRDRAIGDARGDAAQAPVLISRPLLRRSEK